MAVDVVLWFILAAMIACVCCGCILTAPGNKHARHHYDSPGHRLDRAA